MLPVYKLSKRISARQVFELAQSAIEKDWYGKTLAVAPSFVVAVCAKRLYFGASRQAAACCDKTLNSETFAEGLWKNDAAELFLRDDHTEMYQEFNLGPQGAWWTGLFSSYRVSAQDKLRPSPHVETWSEISKASWRAALSISLDSLSLNIGFSASSRANVSFTLGSGPEQYLSWAKLPSAKPDFHLAEHFGTVMIKS